MIAEQFGTLARLFPGRIAWMSLYFTVAVWASLALCVAYALGDHLPHDRIGPVVRALILVG